MNKASFWLLLILHIVSQIVSWIICAHLIETHPGVHICITSHTFLIMLGFTFVTAIIIGSLPLLVKPNSPTLVTVSPLKTYSCSGCVCYTSFTESNAILTRRRVFFLSLFQAIFFPIWIQMVEHSYHILSMIFNIVLISLVCFTYANVFAIQSNVFIIAIVWSCALTAIMVYIGFLALSICSFNYDD